MRRLLSLMLAILISGMAFGQIQPINVSKILDKSKESKTSITQSITQVDRVQRDDKTIHFADPNKAITGTFSLFPTAYIPGDTMILNFTFTFSSPDLEYCDGISITFPTGMTPLETNTSTAIGGGTLVTPISGNTVVWGQISTPSGYGHISIGSYDFQVQVVIGASLTGPQSINCYAMGDGFGSAPHAINQTITMTKAPANDIAVTNINLPTSGCDVSGNYIAITLQNLGLNAQSNIPVTISINNGTPITETVSGPIASGSTLDYIFTQNFNFSVDGVYNITAYTSLSDDTIHNNDTMHGVVNNYAPTQVPITINFENTSLNNSYTIVDNNGDDTTMFFLNSPTYAHSGNIALAYQYSKLIPADDYFFSSCIDLTAGESYKLSLWYSVASAYYPESFEVYLASGPSVADTIGSPIISVSNATNTTYAEATANNVTVSSNGSYYIAIRVTSDTNMYALFIDDIKIDKIYNNDIAITNIDLPKSGCDVSANSSITVTLINEGTMAQSNIPVKIAINNGTPITETVSGPIASGDTLDYTFSQNFDFSTDGDYNITAYSSLSSDENHNNDTMYGVVNNYAPSPVPITINFEDINLYDRYTIVDNNGDDTTFFYLYNSTYAHSGSYSLAYQYSVNNPADDYFFSSCIDLTADQVYRVSLWYRVAGDIYPESFEVYLASAPSVAGIIGSPIISVSNATNVTYAEPTANNVTVASDGSYYIAIRATSDADMYALYIDDITIDFSNYIKENENHFNIYPNPANDLLTINSNTTMNQITIINSLGQVVMNVEPNTDFYQININTLPEGIYTARITTNNGLSTKLIVVAH